MMTDHTEFVLFNVYFPNSRDGKRLTFKLEFYSWLESIVNEYISKQRKVIITGDFNTIISDIDTWEKEIIENGKFKEEMVWINSLCGSEKGCDQPFVDAFRFIHSNKVKYTWWNQVNQRRSSNLGYRIDFFLIDKALIDNLEDSDIWDFQTGSDHCPISLVLKIDIPTVAITHDLSSDKLKKIQPKIFQFFKPNNVNNSDNDNAQTDQGIESYGHVNKKIKKSL